MAGSRPESCPICGRALVRSLGVEGLHCPNGACAYAHGPPRPGRSLGVKLDARTRELLQERNALLDRVQDLDVELRRSRGWGHRMIEEVSALIAQRATRSGHNEDRAGIAGQAALFFALAEKTAAEHCSVRAWQIDDVTSDMHIVVRIRDSKGFEIPVTLWDLDTDRLRDASISRRFEHAERMACLWTERLDALSKMMKGG